MVNVLIVQFQALYSNPDENLLKLEKMLSPYQGKEIDLIIIPEFFATSTDYVNHAQDEDGGYILERIKTLCTSYNSNIVAGSIVRRKSDNRLYNTAFALDRKGNVIAEYDKIHLYNYFGGAEGSKTTPGSKAVCADFDFGKTGIAICFDIRFPELFHDLLKQGARLIALPTAWIFPTELLKDEEFFKEKEEIWQNMAKVRAFDNEVFFIVCNQTGVISPVLSGLGNSMVTSPYGKMIANLGRDECTKLVSIDLNEVDISRKEFPVHTL